MDKIILSQTTLADKLPDMVWGIGTVAAVVGVGTLLAILIVWTIFWKGLTLWRAARNGAKIWFIILLLVNTVGILDIIYYFYASKKSWGKK